MLKNIIDYLKSCLKIVEGRARPLTSEAVTNLPITLTEAVEAEERPLLLVAVQV